MFSFCSLVGFPVKSAYNLPPDWKANIPYTLDSVARYSYQEPVQQQELKLPASRYGSNKKKQLAASGTSKYCPYIIKKQFFHSFTLSL